MRWQADTRRLLQLKQQRMQAAAAEACREQAAAHAHEQEAQVLRRIADEALLAAVPVVEYGLDRRGLYERLRILSVSRAHALETSHQAISLQQQASACQQRADAQRAQAQLLERKRRKLDRWLQHRNALLQRRCQIRLDDDIQETYACPPPFR